MIQQLDTKVVASAKTKVAAGANNTLTPTQREALKKLIEDYLKEEELEADVYVGERKVMVILPE